VAVSNIEKKKLIRQLIGQTAECSLNVLCNRTIGFLGIQRNVFICTVKTVMGNPNVLSVLYEELRIIRFYCPC
jgi:hypothetical protein